VPRDEYDDFLERVRHKVAEIVRREGRGLRKMCIYPPRADGAWHVRTVHIFLEPGPSLLDRLHFEFVEVSGSRLMWDGGSILDLRRGGFHFGDYGVNQARSPTIGF
jgi:hypothetical protein